LGGTLSPPRGCLLDPERVRLKVDCGLNQMDSDGFVIVHFRGGDGSGRHSGRAQRAPSAPTRTPTRVNPGRIWICNSFEALSVCGSEHEQSFIPDSLHERPGVQSDVSPAAPRAPQASAPSTPTPSAPWARHRRQWRRWRHERQGRQRAHRHGARVHTRTPNVASMSKAFRSKLQAGTMCAW